MGMGVSEVLKAFTSLEVYIYLVLAIGSILVVFGSSRRRYNNAFLRLLIMVVFSSSFTLITYIIGQMVEGARSRGLFFLIWAGYLLTFQGISDGISAQSLEDNEQWSRSFLALGVAFVWLYAVLVMSHLPSSTVLQMIIGGLSCGPSTYKASERIDALRKGSKNGVALDTKKFAGFMAGNNHQHKTAYHNYVVNVKGEASSIDISCENVISVGKVFNCPGRLLSAAGDPDSKMKDLCLSFSMYNLLCCHFAGYSFPQTTRDRQLEFVRGVLLHGDVGAGENYRRIFRLIELELGFLHDRFYTKYANLFEKEAQVLRFLFFASCAAISVLFYLMPLEKDTGKNEQVKNDILVTRIIIGVFTCLEFLQFFFLVVSNWGKLFCLCKYVGKPSWRSNRIYEQFVQVVCSFPSSQLWGRQLGQYCFLDSFYKSPGWIFRYPFSLFLENSGKGHAGSYFVPLPPKVQRAVLGWIKKKGRRLTKGRSSLVGNGVRTPELLSACEFKETTKVIMVWHIATSLCEFQHGKTCRSSLETFEVSEALSKYCAYLVVFASRLLPDHYICTNELFASAVFGAEWQLKGCKSMEDKYSRLMNFAEIAQTEFVAGIGGRVAKLLMEEAGDDEERLWKILADFWTEMVLFVAPADDPWPHAEHLAQGGEFVTHLMALLFHAGVAKREFIVDDEMV